MKSELEELIAQKKELEKRIKELTNPRYEVDGAKLYRKTNSGGINPRWIVSVDKIDGWAHTSNGRNTEVAIAPDKEEALKYIQYILASLVTLYNEVSDSVTVTLGAYPKTDGE